MARLQYEWASRWHAKADANAVGRRIEEIAERSGTHFALAPPAAIVEDAKREDSPMHGCFTWNIQEAAEKRWLDEARDLVQKLVVVVVNEVQDEEPRHVKAFVSVVDDDGTTGYTMTRIAASDPDLRQQMLADALAGLRSWRRRYNELRELRPVLDAIDQLQEELDAVRA